MVYKFITKNYLFYNVLVPCKVDYEIKNLLTQNY